jgi:hypothetical protein
MMSPVSSAAQQPFSATLISCSGALQTRGVLPMPVTGGLIRNYIITASMQHEVIAHQCNRPPSNPTPNPPLLCCIDSLTVQTAHDAAPTQFCRAVVDRLPRVRHRGIRVPWAVPIPLDHLL